MGVNSRTVDFLLRLEWAAVLAAAIAGYLFLDGSWQLFVLLILAPDLAMLGYLAGPAAGAIVYNAFHILVWPAILSPAACIASMRRVILSLTPYLISSAHLAAMVGVPQVFGTAA